METGYRERQETNPNTGRLQRFNPRPGFLQLDPEYKCWQIACSKL